MPASRQQRKFLLISGSPSHCHRQALEQVDRSALWIGWKAPHPFQAFEPGRLEQKLGSEVEQLVFDALEGFDPNAFAMALGLVRGGGRFFLLTPPLSDWPSLPDRELARLAVAGWHQVGSSLFLERFAALLMEQPTPTPTASDGQSGTWEALTKDQARALERLEHLARGHPHRPVMITADRGRGKSALFGIFAARLLTEGRRHILVTAPRQSATRILFRHALENLPGARQRQGRVETDGRRLEFMAPDALIEKKPAAELLLIDEAAGIPLPLLEKLILVWPRVALASTVHGYEGSGRGFLLKLGRWMDELRPQWHHIHLQEPVRWASGDRLEAFGRRLLLLDAEPEKIDDTSGIAQGCDIQLLERRELAKNESLLRSLFGLLVSAHYRTTPLDLRYLMDAPNLDVHALFQRGRLLGAALVAREGELPLPLRKGILSGRRRPRGHLLPQLLASRCGLRQALEMRCERVVRIAVHPAVQGRGLGSRLLNHLIGSAAERGVEILGTSFGATPEVFNFWKRAGFQPLRLGYRREASSGSHALVMALSLNNHSQTLIEKAASRFQQGFPLQLGEIFRDLDPSLALALLVPEKTKLKEEECRLLEAFAAGSLPYLDALPGLHSLCATLSDPTDAGQRLLLEKVLQRRSWQELAERHGLAGRKAVIQLLRKAVIDLAQCRSHSG